MQTNTPGSLKEKFGNFGAAQLSSSGILFPLL
jgi:hypothetical protein